MKDCCAICFKPSKGAQTPGTSCTDFDCKCHRPTTSPEKWETEFEKLPDDAHCENGVNKFYAKMFVKSALENQKKEVLAVLEGMKRSNVVTEPDSRCPAFNEALTEAITKITNL